jgi:beta-galactosidase
MTTKRLKAILPLAIALLTGHAHARETILCDADWKFQQQEIGGAEQVEYDDASWRTLDLPHDWSIEGEYSSSHPMGDRCGYLPAGIGWYRKTIAIPQEWKGKHVEIAFDGVFMNSTVWANGQKLGNRPYGWSSFAYDISEQVKSSDSITFAVRVDNDQQPSARWYTGSGIYGHTWLVIKDPLHLERDGIFVRTRNNSVTLDAEITNATQSNQDITLEVAFKDPQQKTVLTKTLPLSVSAGQTVQSSINASIPNALRWDIESPHLYTAETKIVAEDQTLDVVSTRFGIRDVEWKPETGMWLNGKNIKLQGVCNHQDAGALGTAAPDKIIRFRILQLKAMGCNAIRTAHNPRTPVFYQICDEEGMLVMDEIFDGWRQKADQDYGARFFDAWWNRDLSDWIRRDRNHPSIVIWSVGNETKGEISKELVARCHELDPTRPVTSGHAGSEDMDVLGVNGSSENMHWWSQLETENKSHPRVFIGTENTHTWQVRGFYRTKTWFRDGDKQTKKRKPYPCPDLTEEEIFTYDWTTDAERRHRKQVFNSSYDNAMVRMTSRKNIELLRDIPHFAGSFRWTGHDYLGEAGYVHGGWPFKAFMGGAIDLANFEKDLYYLYQSQWTDRPMVHILPHWTHPTMEEGTRIPVQVYSNCEEVEMFFNGKSLGKQQAGTSWEDMPRQWMISWRPGSLKAVGYNSGKVVAEQLIHTADAPAQIALSIDGEPLSDSGKDMVQVRVSSQDSKGEFYPYGENRTWFHLIGPANIKALDNGSPIDVEPHWGVDNRIAFFGLTRAYVEASGEPGDIALLASSILGEKKLISSNKVSIDTELIALRGSLPSAEIRVFYTTDGSTPNEHSSPYTGAFEVPLGTTVKALVMMNGKPVHILEERFAKDVGFVWTGGSANESSAGEQAESAKFKGAMVETAGKNFHGKGFLRFQGKAGSYVEWYQENDGDSGLAELKIRYSGKLTESKGHRIQLSVNGTVLQRDLLLPNTRNTGNHWRTLTISIPIERGANSIRITPESRSGLCIDEIVLQ